MRLAGHPLGGVEEPACHWEFGQNRESLTRRRTTAWVTSWSGELAAEQKGQRLLKQLKQTQQHKRRQQQQQQPQQEQQEWHELQLQLQLQLRLQRTSS